MKSLIIIIFFAFFVNTGFSQLGDSSSQRRKDEKVRNFNDQNGDGLSDRPVGGKKQRQDKFVDANGDGICDSREQGLGFKRSGRKSPAFSGKQNQQSRGGKK